MPEHRTALVTGGNRGIGLEICRGLARAGCRVFLGARDPDSGLRAAAELSGEGGQVSFLQLNVADAPSIDDCCAQLGRGGRGVDILVNNAGVYGGERLLGATEAEIAEGLETNVIGPLRLCRHLIPPMQAKGYGRVVNVSSGLGQLSGGLSGGAGVYNLSKAILNALTIRLALEAGPSVKVNAMCPGWVRTRMGGESAPRTPQQGADTAIWLARLPPEGPTGGFFRDRQPIPW